MTPPRNRDTLEAMSSPTIWSAGRYDAVGDRIAPIAAEVVAAVDRRRPVRGAAVADLACGTGSAALAAAAAGARVTARRHHPRTDRDRRAEGRRRPGAAITWVTADAVRHRSARRDRSTPWCRTWASSSSSRPGRSPRSPACSKPGGVLGFSSWVPDPGNPFFSPIVAVLGPPPASALLARSVGCRRTRSPTGWRPISTTSRSKQARHTWQLGTDRRGRALRDARIADARLPARQPSTAPSATELLAAFEDAMRAHVGADGNVSYDAPYVVVTAPRR